MSLTVTDLFCGAGGSSHGAEQIPGVRTRMAANHWALAIETHNSNFPDADHDCADVSQVDPRRYPRTDILWASPECTNHSQAKGRRRQLEPTPDMFGETLPSEAAERSRATMWDVVRFTEHHRYRAVIVENVVDAYHWAPFKAWLLAMDSLGYDHQVVWLNSMHAQAMGAPAPQSRDRMYVVFWRHTDRRPDLARWTSPKAWCPRCETTVRATQVFKRHDRPAWGRYRQQYLYRCPRARCHQVVEPGWLPAAAAIDWTLRGERIGGRAKPLASKTRMRIEAGLRKYARPIHLEAAGNTYDAASRGGTYWRAWPVDEVLSTQHTTASKALAYGPLMVPVEGRDGKQAQSAEEPLRTQTARNETGLAVPPPFLMRHYTTRGQIAQMCTSVEEASPTQTATFVPSLLVPAGGTWNDDARPIDEPMRTRITRDTEALVVPLRNNNTTKRVSDPLDTVAAAGNHHALVMRNNGSRGDGGEHCTSPGDVIRTVTTAGHQSLVRWDHLLIDYNGPARPVTQPLPTQTTVEGDALASLAVNVDDCYFRMLEPHEIAAAMAFAADYVLLGNKRERVRLCGNAVTPPAARDLIAAVVEALTGEAVA